MNLLVFSMYPIVTPQHGGQLRTRAIFDAYRSLKGFNVKYCGLALEGFYESFGRNDIVISRSIFTNIEDSYAPDLALAQNIVKNKKVMGELVSLLNDVDPDVIHCEQPFAYYVVKEALSSINWQGKMIYGSQNIEYMLRESILKNESSQSVPVQKIVKNVRELEEQAIGSADLVVACTASDAKELKKMGAKKIVIAPNGINPINVDPENYNHWKRKFEHDKINKIFLFVGSAHEPNIVGFGELIGYKLGFMPSNSRIMVVGGIETLLKREFKKIPEHIAVAFMQRANILGAVSAKDLASLISLSDCILLPITQGGGSNLKTAEAILSGKKIIATPKALISYEEYQDLPQITIANNKTDFHDAINAVISNENINIKLRKDVNKVTWEFRLGDLLRAVEGLNNG